MGYPIYHEADLRNLPKGLYLGLMHGRDFEYQQLENWGSNGPLIGPIKYCHTTYGCHLKFEFEKDHADHLKCYEDIFPGAGVASDEQYELFTTKSQDMVICVGKLYGDWCVFYNDEGRS